MTRRLEAGVLVQPDRVCAPGCVTIRGHHIEAAGSCDTAASHIARLTPGLIDLQVNGYGGIDVATCNAAEFRELGRKLARTGVTSFLATLISNPVESMAAQLECLSTAIDTAWPDDAASPLGFHLEGPFLNPGKRGAHLARHLLAPDPVALDELLAAGAGHVRLVTLAPELDAAAALIEQLVDRGIAVAAGHSQASYEQAIEAFDRGVQLCTHLGNAMPALHHRAPGLITACLVDPRVTVCLIPDLVHVHEGMLRLALACKGPGRIVLVTDSITAAGLPDGRHVLAGQPITVEDGVCRDAAGALAGSTLRLDRGLQNFAAATQLGPVSSTLVSATSAARAVGADEITGAIAPDLDADLIEWDSAGRMLAVWTRGTRIEVGPSQSSR